MIGKTIVNITETVKFDTIKEQGRNVIPPLPFTNELNNYLEVLSIVKNIPINQLGKLLGLPMDGEVGIALFDRQGELFDKKDIQQIGDVIEAVEEAIFANPDNVDVGIFERLNIQPKKYDKIVDNVNKEKSFSSRKSNQ